MLYQWLWGIPCGISEEVTPEQIIFTRRWQWCELFERLFRKSSRIKIMLSYLTLHFCIWWSIVTSASPFILVVGSWGEDTALCRFRVLLWRSLWEELTLKKYHGKLHYISICIRTNKSKVSEITISFSLSFWWLLDRMNEPFVIQHSRVQPCQSDHTEIISPFKTAARWWLAMEGHMLQGMICRIKLMAVIARVSAQRVSIHLSHFISENPEKLLLKVSAKSFPLICCTASLH